MTVSLLVQLSLLPQLLPPKQIKMIFGLLWFMLVVDIDPSLCHGAYNNITQMCQIHFPGQYVLNP